ncbi:MAG: M13-type metalloendopeptidase, partial [Candidatus Limnocylindria bacterium]
AYYNPAMNEIVFPAGILQPPFYDPNRDDAYNYGSVGAVIGHEMTHGFDDQGAKFDAKGNLSNWWTPADLAAFQKQAECIQKQFDEFKVGANAPLTNLPEFATAFACKATDPMVRATDKRCIIW